MSGYTLDAGALIALERGDQKVRALLADALERGWPVRVPSGAMAQTWRDPRRQVVLGRLASSDDVEHVPLDLTAARAIGLICAATGHADVIDASVAACAQLNDDAVITSDARHLRRLLGRSKVIAV